MIATPEMLAALEPGELLVRIVRDGWTIPPNQTAIAQANRALSDFATKPGTFRSRTPNDSQAECLAGVA